MFTVIRILLTVMKRYLRQMKRTGVICVLLIGLALLTGCEALRVKLDGGSQSGVDWAVGVRF